MAVGPHPMPKDPTNACEQLAGASCLLRLHGKRLNSRPSDEGAPATGLCPCSDPHDLEVDMMPEEPERGTHPIPTLNLNTELGVPFAEVPARPIRPLGSPAIATEEAR